MSTTETVSTPVVVSPATVSPATVSPATVSPALSNRAVKRAVSQLLNFGTLPKGFAKELRENGTEDQRAAIADARKTRAETFALSKEARRIALAQVNREAMAASKFAFADSGDGKARLSYA